MCLPTYQMMRMKTKMTSKKRVRVKESSDTVALVLYRQTYLDTGGFWFVPRFPGFHRGEADCLWNSFWLRYIRFHDNNKCAKQHTLFIRWHTQMNLPVRNNTICCAQWKAQTWHTLEPHPSPSCPKKLEWGHPSHPCWGRKIYMMRASNTCWKKTILEETNQSEWNLFPY